MDETIPPVQMTSAMVDVKQPFFRVRTRYDYIERFWGIWKEAIRYRMYAILCALVGLYLLVTGVYAISVVLLGVAAYFWQGFEFRKSRVSSQRSVMIGH